MDEVVEQVYEQNFDTLYRYFYFRTLNVPVAEDLTSQTFMAFVDAHLAGKPMKNYRQYLFGIARNIFNAHLREKYKTSEYCIEDMDDFASTATDDVSDTLAISLEARAERFIEQLPGSQRKVAKLRLLDRYSNKDIATMLDKDSNYVKTTLRRALRSLEKMVETNSLTSGEEA